MSTWISILSLAGVALAGACDRTARDAAAPERDLLAGAWSAEQARPLLEATRTIRLAADLSGLSRGERAAVGKLLEVGAIMHSLYEDQLHPQAAAARAQLERRGPAHLRTLYRLFAGPIANNLDNQRVPFLAVEPHQPGRNVYPWRLTRAELDAFLAAHPDQREALTAPRTVVRRAADAAGDLAALDRHPVLDVLHPGLRAHLERVARAGDRAALYALPYSVAWADRIVRAHALLAEAADLVQADDPELAGYLRNRGRDLLSDDYESGDAAWVTARFRRLNAVIGAYETYDDELHGSKAFFELSLLALRGDDTERLRAALGGLQAFEDSLPYAHHKRVRENIPVGVYDIIADFGHARGTNTATILPNEAYLARRYGRTILLRANIMRSPELAGDQERVWRAAVAPAHAAELTAEGEFQRTLWHEIGHYLGVDTAGDGRDLESALAEDASLLEEMKADLVALFVADALRARGYYDDAALRAVEAAGIARVLQNNRPRRDQPYRTMQLIQWNFFLEKGLLRFEDGRLAIDRGRYQATVAALLELV
ncbi:MAG TPA: hypothetical protein VFU21_03470, partial [Kofleriaceae bacterium]|nr:hypothetical protein [Kofleriaceae bacterium]